MTDEIHGFCEDRFAPLKDAFIGNFEAGRELGASQAVTWQGRMVVDLWGGWADLEMTRPWQASWAIMDPKAGVSLGYAPNDFSIEPDGVVDPRQSPIGKALYKLLPTL